MQWKKYNDRLQYFRDNVEFIIKVTLTVQLEDTSINLFLDMILTLVSVTRMKTEFFLQLKVLFVMFTDAKMRKNVVSKS